MSTTLFGEGMVWRLVFYICTTISKTNDRLLLYLCPKAEPITLTIRNIWNVRVTELGRKVFRKQLFAQPLCKPVPIYYKSDTTWQEIFLYEHGNLYDSNHENFPEITMISIPKKQHSLNVFSNTLRLAHQAITRRNVDLSSKVVSGIYLLAHELNAS